MTKKKKIMYQMKFSSGTHIIQKFSACDFDHPTKNQEEFHSYGSIRANYSQFSL
jgi:hypothetical protein